MATATGMAAVQSAVAERPKRKRVVVQRHEGEANDRDFNLAIRNSLKHQKRDESVIPEAPVFYPTAEEFQEPLAYISKITPEASRYGICKIVPPPGHKPKTDYPTDREIRFPTKRQQVQYLQEGKPFGSGTRYTLEEYKKYAEEFTSRYLKDNDLERKEGCSDQEHHSKLEKEFWKIAETGCADVTVDYANDLNSVKFGSGFEHDPDCKWNMNTLHMSPHSLLKEIQCEIQGVTKPWVYLGSLFTSFCWHTEDHYLYSLNYMHKGAGKTWYGIPATSKAAFDNAMKTFMPKMLRKNPSLLYQLITLRNPNDCMREGVKVFHTVQKEGEFVITFPNAYHGGFSHGLNCAEAVNFALPQWLPFGQTAMEDYHTCTARKGGKRADIFAHDQLLYHLGMKVMKIVLGNKDKLEDKKQDQAALNACIKKIVTEALPYDPKPFLKALLDQFSTSAKMELHLRNWLKAGGVELGKKVPYSNGKPPQCYVCKNMPYFSHVQCKNHPERIACPRHGMAQCDCKGDCKGLSVVVTEQGIESMRKFIASIEKAM